MMNGALSLLISDRLKLPFRVATSFVYACVHLRATRFSIIFPSIKRSTMTSARKLLKGSSNLSTVWLSLVCRDRVGTLTVYSQ